MSEDEQERGAAERKSRSFHWSELRSGALTRFTGAFRWVAERRVFDSNHIRIFPPLVLPPAAELAPPDPSTETARERAGRLARARRAAEMRGSDAPECDLSAYIDALPAELPRQVVILMQAGATSIGYFEAGAPLATKSFKRYVKRGNGRAQPTYLKSKGKSRYGARLRLQNAKNQLSETNARLREHWTELGPPADVFVGAPKRLWADALRSDPAPPEFDKTSRLHHIGLDLPVPTTEVMLRTYKRMQHVRWELLTEGE